jgi:hypothetical protein
MPPESSAHPREVWNALRRGLDGDPEKRFESMDALLVALSAASNRTRRARSNGALVAALLIAAAGVGGGILFFNRAPREDKSASPNGSSLSSIARSINAESPSFATASASPASPPEAHVENPGASRVSAAASMGTAGLTSREAPRAKPAKAAPGKAAPATAPSRRTAPSAEAADRSGAAVIRDPWLDQ